MHVTDATETDATGLSGPGHLATALPAVPCLGIIMS